MARSDHHHAASPIHRGRPHPPRLSVLDWLSYGGEMSTLARTFNWTGTPLGAPDRWSRSLKTVARIMFTARQPVFLWWGPRLIHLYNDSFRMMLGPRHPGAFAQPASLVWHDIWDELGPRAEVAMQGGPAADETLLLIPAANGSDQPYCLFGGTLIPDDDGRVGGLLCTNTEEMPRARLLEWEQSTRRQAERQREYLYSLLMQAPAIFVILRGSEYVIDLATPFACEMAGRRHEEVIKRSLFEVLPELERNNLRPLLDRVVSTGVPFVGKEMSLELDRHGDRGRETLCLNFLFSPLRNLEGEIDGVFVTASDVTEQVADRHRMEQLRATAEMANRAKDDFLAMLGHELRNPLAPIQTALRLIRQRGADRALREQAVIERQVQQLTHLVDDLLDVSRIARGKVALKKTRLELADVVTRAVETAGPLIEQRDHRLIVDVPSTGLVIDGDPARLSQVVSNLLTNAAKYTEPGGEIRVAGSREGGEVVLRVRDTGVGIAPQMLPRIFDLFTRVRSSVERVHEGLGLGLAIVRNLVTLHRGTVSAVSAGLGQGSEFIVKLPAAATAVPAARPITGLLGPITVKSHHARVLIVDDNEDAARMLAAALEPSGFETEVACNGPAALRLCNRFSPDIALLDIGMPIMDGYQLADAIRRMPGLEQVALVAVTGYGLQADQDRSEAAGFLRHLVKPIDIDLLTAVLEDLKSS